MKWTAILMALLLMPVAFAQNSAIATQAAGVTPDSLLYGLDKAWDNIKISMSQDKVKARLEVAGERVAEYEAMVEKNKMAEANNALADSKAKVADVEGEMSKLTAQKRTETQTRLYAHMRHLEQVRARIQAKHPEAAQGIDNAIANTNQHMERIQAQLPAEQVKTQEQLQQEYQVQTGQPAIQPGTQAGCQSWETEEDGRCITKSGGKQNGREEIS